MLTSLRTFSYRTLGPAGVFISARAAMDFCSAAHAGLALLLLCSVALGPAVAHVHKNRDGSTVTWYPKECCNDGDCRPVATIQRAKKGLWLTTVDGYTILVGDDETLRASRDTRWHVCLGPLDVKSHAPTITCIFAPISS